MNDFDNILFEMTTEFDARRDKALRDLRDDALWYARVGMTTTMNNTYREIQKLVGAVKNTKSR